MLFIRTPQRPRAATGMTVVELLAAVSLGALMMVLVLTVMGSLSARRQALIERAARQPWQQQLAGQIHLDLVRSSWMELTAGKLILRGLGGTDFEVGSMNHRTAEITYSIQNIAGRSWLMRRETHMLSPSSRNARSEPLAAGVGGLVVANLDGTFIPPGKSTPIPESLAILVSAEHGNKRILDQVMYLR